MLTCKQVSRALNEGDYQSLPASSRWALRLHVAVCAVCGRYNRQVMVFHDAARHWRHLEDGDAPEPTRSDRLSPQAVARIREALRNAPPETAPLATRPP